MTNNSKSVWNSSFSYFLQDIKLTHSIFALPFVFTSLVFINFDWELVKFLWIILCMVCARSFAMGMNRYLDRKWDSLNPRTQGRMIPKGHLASYKSLAWSLCFGFAFIIFSFQLGKTPGVLSPLVLLILGLYPLMKTVSWLTHWYLGLCLGLSPIGASVALRGDANWDVILLGLAITLWTAGFDILYSLQDYTFDCTHSLKSVPSRFGVKNSLLLSRLCFILMVFFLGSIGFLRQAGSIYFTGIILVAGILTWEQWLVRSSTEDKISSKLGLAFFNANACVGIVFYLFTQLDALIK